MTTAINTPPFNNRLGGWLPHDRKKIAAFLKRLRRKRDARVGEVPLLNVVRDLRTLIETNGAVYATANAMISQAKEMYHDIEEEGLVLLNSYEEMCDLINEAIQEPPPYNSSGLVAFPINAIVDLVMATPAGYGFFASERVNAAFRAIISYWGDYLSSDSSLIAFKPTEEGGGGWMSDDAKENLQMDQYVQPDPNALAWGYQSWNNWFIRRFKQGERPIDSPADEKVVVNACESTPFALQTNVQLRSEFWLKGQPYSLAFMLGGEKHARPFEGGTVYQAFLSAFNYHRWHAPVDGIITEAFVLPGTYYLQTPAVGLDEEGPNNSQGFITNVAARAVIKIQADNPSIGNMCVVTVGMSEVSSNVLIAPVGSHVKKGDELGYFLFGGSTHCLVFRPNVIDTWIDQVTTEPANVIRLGVQIATVL